MNIQLFDQIVEIYSRFYDYDEKKPPVAVLQRAAYIKQTINLK